MEIIEGNKLAALCDYSFGDHHVVWDKNVTGTFEPANISNAMFLAKCKQFEGKVMSLFIDNIRLYGRSLEFTGPNAQGDASFIDYLMQTNDLLNLCGQFPKNKFVIFTSHEDTPIGYTIVVPENVLGIHAVNALYNDEKIHPFPIGLQRQIGENDKRLEILTEFLWAEKRSRKPRVNTYKEDLVIQWEKKPSKLLYINCGIGRNKERQPLAKFETNEWCTTRFDKDSKFFPYDHYYSFLNELRDHKFVACPKGHGYDTHRVWETLYMRRVPVMIDDPYFRKLLEGFPVLFVNNWEDLRDYSKQLLLIRTDLYHQAQTMDLNKLDLNLMFKEIMKQYE